jgi:hypothetical protein
MDVAVGGRPNRGYMDGEIRDATISASREIAGCCGCGEDASPSGRFEAADDTFRGVGDDSDVVVEVDAMESAIAGFLLVSFRVAAGGGAWVAILCGAAVSYVIPPWDGLLGTELQGEAATDVSCEPVSSTAAVDAWCDHCCASIGDTLAASCEKGHEAPFKHDSPPLCSQWWHMRLRVAVGRPFVGCGDMPWWPPLACRRCLCTISCRNFSAASADMRSCSSPWAYVHLEPYGQDAPPEFRWKMHNLERNLAIFSMAAGRSMERGSGGMSGGSWNGTSAKVRLIPPAVGVCDGTLCAGEKAASTPVCMGVFAA